MQIFNIKEFFKIFAKASLVLLIVIVNIQCTTSSGESDGETPYYLDADGDGFGDSGIIVYDTSLPEGYAEDSTDCDDTDETVYPDAEEIEDDGIDNDCDGETDEAAVFYLDADGDGFGDPDSTTVSEETSGYVEDDTDCDDSDETINPDATELLADGIDQDCTGSDIYITNQVMTRYDSTGTTAEYIQTSEFNSDGDLTYQTTDSDGDGTSETFEVYTYDSDSKTVTVERHDVETLDNCTYMYEITYNDHGDMIKWSTDSLCDGSVEAILSSTIRYETNAAGNEVVMEKITTLQSDTDGDGSMDTTTVTTNTYEYTYDSSDIMQTKLLIVDGDLKYYYEYDEDGHETMKRTYDSSLGYYTSGFDYEYDSSGFLTTSTYSYYDSSSAALEVRHTKTYDNDALGVPETVTKVDSSGSTNYIIRYETVYSE